MPTTVMNRRRLLESGMFAFALAALGPSTPGAEASLVVAMELPALTAQADAIVVGHVIATRSFLQPDGRRIRTEIQLQVKESWKGQMPGDKGLIQIVQPGGVVGKVEMIVHGLPSFRQGEQAVVFLTALDRQRAERGFMLTGLGQGKRSVFADASGRMMAAPADRSAAVLRGLQGQWVQAAPENSIALDDLRQQVRLLLEAGR